MMRQTQYGLGGPALVLSGALFSGCATLVHPTVSVNKPPIVVVPYAVGKEACSINHRVMIAPVTLCGTMDGKYNCLKMTLKLKFLGDQVLYYDSVSESSGVVFQVGKTIDLKTDSRQDARWRAKPKTGGVATAAIATASREGDLLRLGWDFTTFDVVSGRTVAVTGQAMTLRTASCTNMCRFLDYTIFFNDGRPEDVTWIALRQQACRFE